MKNTRKALHDYINILDNNELNHLCKVILELSKTSNPLLDEIQAISLTQNDEYIDFNEADWD